MSMKLQKAIDQLMVIRDATLSQIDHARSAEDRADYKKDVQALDVAISKLSSLCALVK